MKYNLILMACGPDERGRLRTTLVGEVDGDDGHIAETMRYTIQSLNGELAPSRGKKVKVLWYEPRLANDPLPRPEVGAVYDSLRALSIATEAKFTSLNQCLSLAKHEGFSGAVHRGMAYAFLDSIEARPGQLPALKRHLAGGVEIIFARDVVATKEQVEAGLDAADPFRHVSVD